MLPFRFDFHARFTANSTAPHRHRHRRHLYRLRLGGARTGAHAQSLLHAGRPFASDCRSAGQGREDALRQSFCTAPPLAQILCCSARAHAWLWSRPPVLKTPSKSAARPVPSFTISSLIAWNLWSRPICALAWKNVPPAMARSFRLLQHQDLQSLAGRLHQKHPEAIAISLLFSFANPKNENAVEHALEELGLPLSVSHQILPEFREYERTSTVVVNAYLQPVMQNYLENLDRRMRSSALPAVRIFVMQSSGGITALSSAVREPVRTVLSGPAGGVVGAAAMARRSGVERIISFDMGGTSTDVALVDGEARASNQAEIAGFPIGVPYARHSHCRRWGRLDRPLRCWRSSAGWS